MGRKRILIKAETPQKIKEKVQEYLSERSFKSESEYLLSLVRADIQKYEAQKEKQAGPTFSFEVKGKTLVGVYKGRDDDNPDKAA